MTNYNERLDEILNDFGWTCIANGGDGYGLQNEDISEAKQAITSPIKELVAEAKPPVIDTPSRIKLYADDEGQMWYDRGQNDAIARFEQNLLEALEEV